MSALAIINADKLEIRISSRLFLYGNEANAILGQKIVNEIVSMWNEPNYKYKIGQLDYNVVFEAAFVVVEGMDIVPLCKNNSDFRNNFIRIEKSNKSERSMMGFGLGENSGHWLSTDNLGDSTTAAHEYGHALGLPHPSVLDYRGTGIPPIMAPRGTLVDANYQWEPSAKAGEFGGTMKPIHRKVANHEIEAIVSKFDFDKGTVFEIGKITNLIFDEIGNVVF